jgi:hypothetical protein
MIDNTPEWAKSKTWLYQVQINGMPRLSGVFESSEELASIKLSGMYSVGTWHRGGVKRNDEGELIAVRLFASKRGEAIEAIATRS